MARRIVDNARISTLLAVLTLLAIVLTTTTASAALLTPTGVTISSSPLGSSVLGQSVAFTTTVTGTGPTPTGAVYFYNGTQLLGIAQLDGTGTANFSTALLPVGTYTQIFAAYQGDTNYSTANSSNLDLTVNPRPDTVSVTALPNPIQVGAATTITASVTDAATTGPLPSPGGVFNSTGTAASVNLQSLRSGHAADLLSDGTVLISGGTVSGSAVTTLETYDPVAGTFANVTGNLLHARSGHTATLLSDGVTTLITGGDAAGDAELYTYNLASPGTGSSVATTGSLQAIRYGHTATLLPNGQVLIIGGSVSGSPVNTLEIYDPATETFANVTGTLAYTRSGHTATLLSYVGNVATLLVAGGDATGTAELITYNTSTKTVTQVGSATWLTARTGHTATLLPDGKTILFAGGTTISTTPAVVATAEIYQIPSDLTSFTSFVTVPAPNSMTIARTGHIATLMNDALVLITGGEADATQSAELYTPAYDPLGTVAISSDDSSDILGTASCDLVLGGGGQSSCSTTLTPHHVHTGTHSVTATYTSDGNHVTDISNTTPLMVTVNKGTQATVTLTGPSAATYGQSGLSASASGGSGTGAYSYSAGASTACSVDSSSGALTITSGTGSCSITATRAADSDYNQSAASSPWTITVSPQTPVISWTPPAITYGTALSATQLDATCTAMVNGAAVPFPLTYTLAAGAMTGFPPQSATGAALGVVLDAGSPMLQASCAPTPATDYNTPAPLLVTIIVNQATPTITWLSPAQITYGTPLSSTQLDAQFSWIVNGTTVPVAGTPVYTPLALTVLSAETHQPLTVNFTPTDTIDYTPAMQTDYIDVAQAPTVSAALVTVGPFAGGFAFTFNGAVAGPNAAANCTFTPTNPPFTCTAPTGSVDFLDGTTTLGTQSLGTLDNLPTFANYATQPVVPGTSLVFPAAGDPAVVHTLTVAYPAGDSNYLPTGATASAGPPPLGPIPTVMELAAPLTVASGSPITYAPLGSSNPFLVPSQTWASGTLALSCETLDAKGNIAATIPCTLTDNTNIALPKGQTTLTGVATNDSVSVTISPSVVQTSALRRVPAIFAVFGMPALGLVFFTFSGGDSFRRRKLLTWLGMALVLMTLLALSGCSSGSFNNSQPISSGSGTAPGTYYVVVSGSYTVNGSYSTAISNSGGTAQTAILVIPTTVQ